MSTLKATYLQQAASTNPNITLDGSANATVGGTLVMGSSFKRNRIINGDMRVDQRNAGASVTPTTTGYYSCDRWTPQLTQASKFSVQQTPSATETGYATRVAAGFTNYSAYTVVSAYTVGAGDYFGTEQRIEGYNIADLNYGQSTAKTATLSFWVYANNTGTYCGSFYTSTGSYVFTYSISVANAWQYVTVTIPGSTAYSFGSTTNSTALNVRFTFSAGSNFQTATPNTWVSGNYAVTSSNFNWIGTAGATWYITGVQLEVGSVATPYERQIYSEQLAQCQRYYYRITAPNTNTFFANGLCVGTTDAEYVLFYPVTMRAAPSALEQTGTASNYTNRTTSGNVNCTAVPFFVDATIYQARVDFPTTGLTGGQAALARANAIGAYLGFSAEL